ncbi:MAG: transketolase, partial [Deltaproteobacteria bacterium]|nr:transketolase [Deltaproteobacteria bacterium]
GLACGIALAGIKKSMSYMTYVLLGDGELNEGSIWEGFLFAAHHKLNNLVVIIDRNHMCCAGYTENILQLEPLDKKLESFGLAVCTVDGHNCTELADELRRLRSRPVSGPTCIIAETVKGKGLPSVESTPMCHHYSPKGEELEKAFAELRGE